MRGCDGRRGGAVGIVSLSAEYLLGRLIHMNRMKNTYQRGEPKRRERFKFKLPGPVSSSGRLVSRGLHPCLSCCPALRLNRRPALRFNHLLATSTDLVHRRCIRVLFHRSRSTSNVDRSLLRALRNPPPLDYCQCHLTTSPSPSDSPRIRSATPPI
jgi:hypothetical protein